MAAGTIEALGPRLIVPWPVFAEADWFLRKHGFGAGANALGRSLQSGDLQLATPTAPELAGALDLLERYGDLGIDLPDATVMAMADARGVPAFTWDFRHFRAVVFRRGKTVPLLVNESEMP